MENNTDAEVKITRYRNEMKQLKSSLRKSENERKKLLTTVNNIEEKLEVLFKNITDIIYILDEEGFITYISDGASQFGYSPEALIGKDIMQFVHPEDRAEKHFNVKERRRGDRRTKLCEIRFFPKGAGEGNSSDSGVSREIVFTISAEGYYTEDDKKKESYTGTIGVAKQLAVAQEPCEAASSHHVCTHDISEIQNEHNLVVICANCKSIKNDSEKWNAVEAILQKYLGTKFTHTICPTCMEILYPEFRP